ncbi:RNA polymerase sigma factor [Bacillus sp. JCM 19034]|uniref:RNA polymerase sigma factor n=1 Tax=Bacillus sp. JCM 19034 TaxID=1481928 RepID=UPI000783C343|nr:sigma-70 family RNA polymerase sigma factor [Bacillus sp. JCM 19034]
MNRADELLKQIEAGSIEAFELFYEQYHRFVFSIAFKHLQNQQEAEDVSHEVFIEVARKAGQYESSRGSVEAWIAIKTRSRSIDWLKRKKEYAYENINEFQEKKHQVQLEENVLRKLDREALTTAMSRLPYPQRQAIYHSYFKELSHREIADKLQAPLGSVKSAIRYGLNNLRKYLSESKRFQSMKGEDKYDM